MFIHSVAVLSTALALAGVRLHRKSDAIPASPSLARPNSLRPPGYIISSNGLVAGEEEGFHDGHVLHVEGRVLPLGGGGRRVPEAGVEDDAVGEGNAGEDGWDVEGGKGRVGEDEIVGAVAVGVGVGIAVLVGGVAVVDEPFREDGEGFGFAGADIEVAAEDDVVVFGKMVADELEEVAGFGGAVRGAVLDEVDADDVEAFGAGDVDGGPGEAAVEDEGVVPLAEGDDGVAAEDAVGEADAAFFAGEIVGKAEDLADEVQGVSAFVVELLDGDDVGPEGLQDADGGVFVGLGAVVGEVGGGDGDGNGAAVGVAASGDGAEKQGQEEMEPRNHDRRR